MSCNRSFKEKIKKTHFEESQIHDTIQLAAKHDTPPPSPPTELFHHPLAPPLVCLDNKSQEKESKDKWDLDAMGMATELEWDISYSEMSLDRKIILENPNLREQVQKDEKELSEEYKKSTPKEFRYCEKCLQTVSQKRKNIKNLYCLTCNKLYHLSCKMMSSSSNVCVDCYYPHTDYFRSNDTTTALDANEKVCQTNYTFQDNFYFDGELDTPVKYKNFLEQRTDAIEEKMKELLKSIPIGTKHRDETPEVAAIEIELDNLKVQQKYLSEEMNEMLKNHNLPGMAKQH